MSFQWTVIKRNGNIVKYDSSKIVNAIKQAMLEIGVSNAEQKSRKVTEKVEAKLELDYYNNDEIPNVDDIQDLVEYSLMEEDYNKTAKAYILYRDKRNESRNKDRREYKRLTDDFISKYKHQTNPFPTELGEFIFYRTYSRWLDTEQRREDWWETVRRAVEYNTSLAPTSKEEAQDLFDNVYNLKNFLSGRTLFSGGTKVSKLYSMQNYNCSFTTIESIYDFGELFTLLMLG